MNTFGRPKSKLLQFGLLLHKLLNNGEKSSMWFLAHQSKNLHEYIFKWTTPVREFVEFEFRREILKYDEPMMCWAVRSSESTSRDDQRELQLTTEIVPLNKHSHNLVRIWVIFNRERQSNIKFRRESRPVLFSVRLRTQRSCDINLRVLIKQQWTCRNKITQQRDYFFDNRFSPFDSIIILFAVSEVPLKLILVQSSFRRRFTKIISDVVIVRWYLINNFI